MRLIAFRLIAFNSSSPTFIWEQYKAFGCLSLCAGSVVYFSPIYSPSLDIVLAFYWSRVYFYNQPNHNFPSAASISVKNAA